MHPDEKEDLHQYNGYYHNFLVHQQHKVTKQKHSILELSKVTLMDRHSLDYNLDTELKHEKHSYVGIADNEYKEEF